MKQIDRQKTQINSLSSKLVDKILRLGKLVSIILSLRKKRKQIDNQGIQIKDIKNDIKNILKLKNLLSSELVDKILRLEKLALDVEDNILAIEKDEVPLNVAFVGEFSSGKSSIINSLIGDEIIPVDDQPMTLAVSRFIHGNSKYIEAVLKNGRIKELSIKDYQELKHTNESNLKDVLNNILGINDISEIKYINFYYPHPLLSKLNIIDTPGFSTANKRGDDEKTLNAIKELADVLIWVVDAVTGTINEESLKKIQEIKKIKKDIKIFIIVNKVDRITDKNQQKVIKSIKEFSEIEDVYPYSSLVIEALKSNDTLVLKIADILKSELNNQEEINISIKKERKKRLRTVQENLHVMLNGDIIYTINSLEKHQRYLEYRNNILKLLEKIRNESIEYLYSSLLNRIEYLKQEVKAVKELILEDLETKEIKMIEIKKEILKFLENFDSLVESLKKHIEIELKNLEYLIEENIYKNVSRYNLEKEELNNLFSQILHKEILHLLENTHLSIKDLLSGIDFIEKEVKENITSYLEGLFDTQKNLLIISYDLFKNIAINVIEKANLSGYSKEYIDRVINEEYFIYSFLSNSLYESVDKIDYVVKNEIKKYLENLDKNLTEITKNKALLENISKTKEIKEKEKEVIHEQTGVLRKEKSTT